MITYTLTDLTPQEINLIGAGLGKLLCEVSFELMTKLKEQAAVQEKAFGEAQEQAAQSSTGVKSTISDYIDYIAKGKRAAQSATDAHAAQGE